MIPVSGLDIDINNKTNLKKIHLPRAGSHFQTFFVSNDSRPCNHGPYFVINRFWFCFQGNLRQYVEQAYQAIIDSAIGCPSALCECFYAIKEAAQTRFPGNYIYLYSCIQLKTDNNEYNNEICMLDDWYWCTRTALIDPCLLIGETWATCHTLFWLWTCNKTHTSTSIKASCRYQRKQLTNEWPV